MVKGSQATPDELQKMYNDPEYADTWRYTNEERYVSESEYQDATPKAYSFLQTEGRHIYGHKGKHSGRRQSLAQHVVTAQVGNKDWDHNDLRSMGLPKDYKNATPDGYKDSVEFQPGDDIVNTDADK